MSRATTIHWFNACVVFILFALATVLAFYKQEAKEVVKGIFEGGSLSYVIWTYVVISVLSHRYCIERVSASLFDKISDAVFSIATYGFAATTSLTLLQGVFLQFFYGVQWFINFGNLDLASIVLVSVYLLIYCGVNTTKLLIDVLFQVKSNETETPTPT